jgi:small subunit ribosomal protein S3
MASERKFIRENTKRALIKNFLVKEIEGAGFGGMTIQRTPIGTRVNILVERPGMVIGKGGSKIKQLTATIQTKFDVENPQIEIQEAGAQAALKTCRSASAWLAFPKSRAFNCEKNHERWCKRMSDCHCRETYRSETSNRKIYRRPC